MLKTIGAALAGLVLFALIEFLASRAALASWPDYAHAAPSRDYSITMLLVRLIAGALGILAASAFSTWVGGGDRRTAFWLGLILLLLSVVHHYFIWDQYPVWYHLAWFALIVPISMLGGILALAALKGRAVY